MNPTKQRNGQYIYVRKLLLKGMEKQAREYAERCGFTLADVPTVASTAKDVAESWQPPEPPSGVEELEWGEPKNAVRAVFAKAASEATTAVETQIQAEAAADIAAALDPAWPTETEAIIWSECPNPRLWIIKLKDGRLCSMHRNEISWQINSKVSVRLVKTQGGACYEAVKVGRPAF